MLTIGIIDDGIGAFATLYKLRQVISANFICKICDNVVFDKLKAADMTAMGKHAVDTLVGSNCDVIVLSSVTLSTFCFKALQQYSRAELYGCETPVMHASTYTASGVLVAGSGRVVNKINLPTVIPCAMDGFARLAELCDEKGLVNYISQRIEPFDGRFDCIALAHSSMNLYKHCFSRVCPNVKIFDSLEGVARKIRKKYKKQPKEEGFCTVIDGNGEKNCEKFAIFLE